MKTIKIEPKDRVALLKYVNVLREFSCNTAEKVPIYYEHVCDIESLMYKLANGVREGRVWCYVGRQVSC